MEEARMSHDAGPTGREPAEGYAGAGSPWAAPPEPGEQRPEAAGSARARAQVPQARGGASVQPPTGGPTAEPADFPRPPHDQQPRSGSASGERPGENPWQPAGPPPGPWREPGDRSPGSR